MTRPTLAVVLIVSLFAGQHVAAQGTQAQPQVQAEAEYAPTPTALAELLPQPLGAFGKSMDFWLLAKTPNGEAHVQRWAYTPGFVITAAGASARADRTPRVQVQSTLRYNQEKRLHAMIRERSVNGEQFLVVGETNGQVFSIDTLETTAEGELKLPTPPRREATYEQLAQGLPEELMPIALAYHLREGHARFSVPVLDIEKPDTVQTKLIEDRGVETVQVDGVDRQAHRLVMHDQPGDGTPIDPGVNVELLVLETGEIVAMTVNRGQAKVQYHRSNAEEIAEHVRFD